MSVLWVIEGRLRRLEIGLEFGFERPTTSEHAVEEPRSEAINTSLMGLSLNFSWAGTGRYKGLQTSSSSFDGMQSAAWGVWDSKMLWVVLTLTLSYLMDSSFAADDQILLTFKSGIKDPKGRLSGWNSSSPFCSWHGVGCDNNRRVTVLNLNAADLSGTIPSALGGLSNLRNLTLSSNFFSGIIPPELGNCSNLQTLLLGSNTLTGEVPPSLGNLTFLKFLDLSLNSLSGSIPVQLGKCINLNRIFFNDNKLSGAVPSALGNLNSLQYLRLSNNNLSYGIPSALGNCSELEQLDLSSNLLRGRIPDSLQGCSNLSILNLTLNHLSGPIPPAIGNFSRSLQSGLRLYLSWNLFSGTFPIELFRLNNTLGELVLSWNTLNGSLPDSFDSFTGLIRLDLSFNLFTGIIPGSIGAALNLQNLSLASNQFQGPIPSSFGKLLYLQFDLDLSNNNLSGNIPEWSFSLVQTINLGGNNLSGGIPDFESCKSLNALNLSQNLLNGTIPGTLGGLQSLVVLDLAKNFLTGSVDDIFHYHNFTSASFLPGNSGLCGSVLNIVCPDLYPPLAPKAVRKLFHKWRMVVILSIAVALFGMCVVLASWLDIYIARSRHVRNSVAYYVRNMKIIRLGVEDLLKATERFNAKNVVGSGGTSTVYKGLLPFYPFIIAVKKFEDTKDGRRRMLKEAGIMKSIRHRHLVGTLGISSIPKSINVLVLEYMVNGTLNHHLHSGEVCQLSWDVRLSIIKDVAMAICYLHEDTGPGFTVIHGDLKPANIFLDFDFLAKIGDFGLTKILSNGSKELVRTERVWEGTFGYAPPGDVYSFGVVLLEMVTRRRPTDALFTETGVSLICWVRDYFPENVSDIVDPSLGEDLISNKGAIELLLKVGLLCTRDNPRGRPEMKEALEMINSITKLNADGSSNVPVPLPTVEQLAAEPSFISFQHARNWGWINNDFLFDVRDTNDNSWFSLFKIDMRNSRILNAMGFGTDAIKSIRNQYNVHRRQAEDRPLTIKSCLGMVFCTRWRRISDAK